MPKLLHVIQDDKFSEALYRDFESVLPGNNEYVILEKKETIDHINSFSPRCLNVSTLIDLLSSGALGDVQGIVLHHLDAKAKILLKRLPGKYKVMWVGYGIDYYHLIQQGAGLLLPVTEKATRLDFTAKIRNFVRKLGKVKTTGQKIFSNGIQALEEILILAGVSPYSCGRSGEAKLLEQVDYFSSPIVEDYDLVAKMNPWFRATYLEYVPNDVLLKIESSDERVQGRNILVANSSSPTSNHLDVFELLKPELLPEETKIICPLSYGDTKYGDLVEAFGKKRYGEKFISLRGYIPLKEYLELLSSCSIVILNHKRQQGMGVAVSSLYRGARVFMREENPSYHHFKNENIHINSINELIGSLERSTWGLSLQEWTETRASLRAKRGKAARQKTVQAIVAKLIKE